MIHGLRLVILSIPWQILKTYAFEEHNTKSLLINTVHDSIVADVFPGEERIVASCLNNGCLGVIQRMKDMYNIDFNVPLDVELKVGSNWLDTKVYA